MMRLIVCTHGRYELTVGAIDSVRRHATDDLRVTVLDSSATLMPFDGVEVQHIDCPAYHHVAEARRISLERQLTVCIHDDMRLVMPVALQERYGVGWHKHLNGHMMQAWTGPAVTTPYRRLSQWRTSQRCEGLPSTLCDYAAATNAEQIDGIWLHIDKGSQPPTPERDALIRYIDGGPGLGDLVKSGLSAVGITEERVSKLIGRPCGCGARAEALNRLGAKLGIGGKHP